MLGDDETPSAKNCCKKKRKEKKKEKEIRLLNSGTFAIGLRAGLLL
jgi:hypothetical protein